MSARVPAPVVRPDAGLSVGERKVFKRLRAAICDTNSSEIDEDAYCRELARTVVAFKAKALGVAR